MDDPVTVNQSLMTRASEWLLHHRCEFIRQTMGGDCAEVCTIELHQRSRVGSTERVRNFKDRRKHRLRIAG
jgi:hypothetical protein